MPLPYLLLIILFCDNFDHADSLDSVRDDLPRKRCSNTNYTENGLFQKNLNNLLQVLPSNASSSKFYNFSTGNYPNKAYGLYMCLDYFTYEECQACIKSTSQDIITRCPHSSEAVVWEEQCQLHYSNKNFFGQLNDSDYRPLDNVQNISQPEKFRSVVNKTLNNLTKFAAYDVSANMYATGEVPFTDDETVYALVQCTRDLSAADCNKCLGKATEDILGSYYFSMGARVLNPSCYLRYELYRFYRGQPTSQADNRTGEDSGRKRWKIMIAAVASACLAMVLFGLCVYCHISNKGNKKGNSEFLGQALFHNKKFTRNDPKAQKFLHFDLATIHAATNNFSESNKLGQGGFGPVYKGILRDGREVAIKRLSTCSEQGSEEFTNEVLLIIKLQHKNLVRLLGFCVDGVEKLLVYEYMPNSSLDVILFEPNMRAQLDWSTRSKIIGGIARGTLYLHEDSRLRIIHRDLKASNVLLDYDMNPKISDFGMARIFAGIGGEANTSRIVGTYGYMAPEYAMEGLYSFKSDVFSFGVLVIEIITGRRNAGVHQTNWGPIPCLLSCAWQLWNEGQVLELMDPLVADSCDQEEFLRFIHIGLLCVQEDAYDRPTMSSVVQMLKRESITHNQPKRPAFFTGRFTKHCEGSGVGTVCSISGLTVSN
ncbi:hypothetical protein UlMin_011419, partial [Ulmus minor]